MSSWTHDSLTAAARRLALALALLTAACGALTVAGFLTGVHPFSSVESHAVAMRPLTAVALLLIGLATAVHGRASRAALRTAGRAAGLLGAALVAVSAVAWISGTDRLDTWVGPLACVGLALLFAALEIDRRPGADRRVVTALAVGGLSTGLLGLVGYHSAITTLTTPTGALRISLGTSLSLVAAGLAILLARPERGAVRLLVSTGPGGLVARRLLPVVVLAPVLLNAARAVVEAKHILSASTSDWLFCFALLVASGLVVVRLARRIDLADLTRRAVDERLRASEALTRSVTDSARDAIVSADDNGRITLFNPAAEQLFGWPAASVLGEPVTLLMPGRFRAHHRDGLEQLAGTAAAGQAVELLALTRDGRELEVELSIAHGRSAAGGHLTAIIRDITPRKAVERMVREETELMVRLAEAQSRIGAGSGELVEIMGLVAEEACAMLKADGAVVELPDAGDMVYRAVSGSAAGSLGLRVPIEGSLAGTALRSGSTLVCLDSETDPRVDREACRRAGLRSMICLPLHHGAGAVGVLKVSSETVAAFSERDVRVLELLASLAASAVHRARVERRLAALHVAGGALARARSLESGLAGALRGVGEQLGWDAGAVWLAEDREAPLWCAEVWHGDAMPAGASPPDERDPLPEAVRRTAVPEWVEQSGTDTAVPRHGLRTRIGVPIISRGETLGVIGLGCREARTHDAETLALIADVATQIGLFVQRRRAEERMATQAANLAAVAEFSRELSRTHDPEHARPAVCALLRGLTRTDAVALLEPDGRGGLVVTAQAGALLQEGLTVAIDDPENLSAGVFRTGRGTFVDVKAMQSSAGAGAGLRSAHLEPLHRDGGVIGVLAIGSREARTADAGFGSLMRLLAAEAAGALALADVLVALDARAVTDELTGATNRRGWDEELPREMSRALRSGAPLTVAIMDLDHFKRYNDAFGHQAGDRLLRSATAAWSERLRTTDLLARYGGEEFAVVLPGCDAEAAARVADALRHAVPDDATCSIGVATWDRSETVAELVARADAALYRAKDGGRDRVVSDVPA
jgi:diguanylate cyclase (GGDEF)-like protein/PAS domain S-box-containing protein